jgi:parvulin-like peptidyl-prolyl isomerase
MIDPSILIAALLLQADATAVVRVGEIALTSAEVSTRAAEFLRTNTGSQVQPGAFIDGLVDELLLATEARRSGLANAPMTRIAVDSARAKLLAKVYWEQEIVAKANPPEEQVRALFHENGDTVRLRLVVLSTRDEAAAALSRLAAGGEFPLEATRSLHRSSNKGGDTGTVGRKDLDPALTAAAFSAPAGKLFGPVELSPGFAVGEVVERTIADEKDLAAQRPTLEAWARQRFAGQARGHFLSMSRKQKGVVLDERFLASIGKSTSVTEAQADHVIATISGRPVRFRELLPELQNWASSGGHMFGPAVRIRVAEAHLDNLLLAAAAFDAGFHEHPDVKAALRLTELSALARAQANQLATSVSASAPPEKRERAIADRLASLRKQISVNVDRPAAIAAAQSAAGTPAPSTR